MNPRSWWPAILILACPCLALAQSPPYQSDFPPDEFLRVGMSCSTGSAIAASRSSRVRPEAERLPVPSPDERVLSSLRDRDAARLSHPGRQDAGGDPLPAPARCPPGRRRRPSHLGRRRRSGEAADGRVGRREHPGPCRRRARKTDRPGGRRALHAVLTRRGELPVPRRTPIGERRHHRGPLGRLTVARGPPRPAPPARDSRGGRSMISPRSWTRSAP